MIEETLPGIYRIEVPLPDNPLQTVNSYLLKGKEKDLLIDTGMNKDECRVVLLSALQDLGANMENIDIFITHLHHDHFGLAITLASNGSIIYLNAPDAIFLGDANVWEKGFMYGKMNGFPEEELQKALEKRDDFLKNIPIEDIKKAIEKCAGDVPLREERFRFLSDEDTLNVGEYSFKCLMTPGHSRGHLCLYETRNKFLFSGDHILEDITPAIFLWPGEKQNPLKDYLNSLDRVFDLEVTTVLPGHRNAFQDYRGRISQIKAHHYRRKEEIASLLDIKGKNVYQIASKVSWNIPLPWNQFTPELKWMALAEILAHLKYMEEEGQVKSELQTGNVIHYYL